LIGAAEAAREAERGLRTAWPRNGPLSEPGGCDEPLLVARLDSTEHYWLVPWRCDRGITAVAQVDAMSGRMTIAGRLPAPVGRIVPSAAEAAAAVAALTGTPPLSEPRLVWRPCRESASPLAPFYEVPTEKGERFVGPDGAVHRELTPYVRNG
jgi:hypothetical protein